MKWKQFMAAKVLKTFLKVYLVFSTSMAFAQQTQYSYQSPRKSFCNSENENGAERLLKELDDLNKDKFRESESLKTELNQSIALMKIVKDYLQKKEDLLNDQTLLLDKATSTSMQMLKDAKQNENMTVLVDKICSNFKGNNVCANPSAEATSAKDKVVKVLLDKVQEYYKLAVKKDTYFAGLQSLFNDDHLKQFANTTASVNSKDAVKSDLDYILKRVTEECTFKVGQDAGMTDQEMVDQFKEFCKNDSIYDLENSKSKAKLAGNIADRVDVMNNRVEQLKEIHSDEEFNKVEVFKSYIAKKYLCMCSKDTETEVYTERTCYNYESHNQISTPTVFRLANAVSAVLADMRFSQDFGSLQNKCSSTTGDRDLLSAVSNNCKKIGDNDILKKVCQIASGEQIKKEDEDAKEKRWADLNRDHWIKKDSSAKDGFIKTEKKKTWELIGEGLKPSLQSAVPIWFNNYQIKANINMLTEQALFEKQYNHTMDIYNQNPWMYGYPFTFQPNFFPVYNSTTTTNVFGTTGTSTGYNFTTGTP